jgi:hypothetical protein
MKKFEPHYRLVRVGMANKIEKASRQQRTFVPTTSGWDKMACSGHWMIWACANGYPTYRQAAQEQGQDNAGHGQDEGRVEEGQEIGSWLTSDAVLEEAWRRCGEHGNDYRAFCTAPYAEKLLRGWWQWWGWRGKARWMAFVLHLSTDPGLCIASNGHFFRDYSHGFEDLTVDGWLRTPCGIKWTREPQWLTSRPSICP